MVVALERRSRADRLGRVVTRKLEHPQSLMQLLPLVWMLLVAWTVHGQAETKKRAVQQVARQADPQVGH